MPVPPPKRRAGRSSWLAAVVLTVVAVNAGLDLYGWWDARQRVATRVSSANDVLLEATPQGEVKVVAEADGRILGTAPLRFLVPDEGEPPVVLLTAPGRTPERVELPSSGRLLVRLKPRPAAAARCVARFSSVPGWSYQGVHPGDPSAKDDAIPIEGSLVVRAIPAGGGAWLLRCGDEGQDVEPGLLERTRRPPVAVAVRRPVGGLVSVGGRPLGQVPVQWTQDAMFVQVAVEAPGQPVLGRFVAATRDLEVRMPTGQLEPKPRLPNSVVEPPARLGPPRRPGRR